MAKKEEIYAYLLEKAPLSEAHKEELRTKRGFSEETIRRNRHGSGGKHLVSFEDEMLSRFPEADLIGSGVFIHDGHSAHISPILLQDRIIIAYQSPEKDIYLIRPHKFGLADVPVEIYQTLNLAESPEEIVITEGEFKADAGMQYGVPTIAVPGIGTFAENHFERLVKILDQYKVRKVTIVFDNEVKDDPQYPERYKDEPNKRHDTPFYAYYIASRLERKGKLARIGMLPNSWRVNGKADIDGALAQGKTASEFRKVLYDAKTHTEFLKGLEAEARTVILRKLAKKRHHSHIRQDFNHYTATRHMGKKEWDEVISNFVIRIVATHVTSEGIVREIQFTNEFGETSRMVPISAGDMPRADSFSAFCLSHGNYIWRGTKEDLSTIWEAEFLDNDGRFIIEPDHIGWIDSEKVWLFGNVAIRPDGTELRPDKNHVFWTEKRGLKPVALGVTSGRSSIEEGIPYLHLGAFDVSEVKEKLADTITREKALLALGWISSIPFMEEIYELYGCFPFLFVGGKKGSGKSTISEWIISFFGLENAGKMISETTQVGIQRYLSYYSCMPLFLDEYRNSKQIEMKNGFLRNAYNRQSAGKGIKANFGLREAKIRGTLLICGEDIPNDSALRSRCIELYASQAEKKKDHFTWFMANKGKFSSHIYQILKQRGKLLGTFLKELEENRQFLSEEGRDPRFCINYAVIATACSVVLGESDKDFASWILSQALQAQKESESSHIVTQFLDEMLYLRHTKKITEDYFDYDPATKQIFLWFDGVYNEFSEHYYRINRENSFSKDAIRKYLKEEECCVSASQIHRWKAGRKRCMIFDYEKAPESLKSLVDLDRAEFL